MSTLWKTMIWEWRFFFGSWRKIFLLPPLMWLGLGLIARQWELPLMHPVILILSILSGILVVVTVFLIITAPCRLFRGESAPFMMSAPVPVVIKVIGTFIADIAVFFLIEALRFLIFSYVTTDIALLGIKEIGSEVVMLVVLLPVSWLICSLSVRFLKGTIMPFMVSVLFLTILYALTLFYRLDYQYLIPVAIIAVPLVPLLLSRTEISDIF